MLKVKIRHGGILAKDDPNKGISVTVYNSFPSKDGTHISATSFFRADMLKRLSQKNIDALLSEFESAIYCCNRDVYERMMIEKDNNNET